MYVPSKVDIEKIDLPANLRQLKGMVQALKSAAAGNYPQVNAPLFSVIRACDRILDSKNHAAMNKNVDQTNESEE